MLYIPAIMSPSNDTFDGANNQDFSVIINGGTCYGYQLYIDQVAVATGTELQIYDSTLIDKTSDPIYDGLELIDTVPGGSVSNTSDYYYKWHIDLYGDVVLTEFIESYEAIFYVHTTPVLGFMGGVPIATVDSSVYAFFGDYTQAEGISVKEWIATLYEDDQVTVKSISPITYSTYLYYQFGGLENNKSYYIKYNTVDQLGVSAESDLEEVVVAFTELVANNTLVAVNDPMTASIGLEWSPFVFEEGTEANPAVYSTLPGYPDRETVEPATGDIYFEVDMNNQFTIGTVCYFPIVPTGTQLVLQASNTNNTSTVAVSYNGVTKEFELSVNGVIIETKSDIMTITDVRIVALSRVNSTYEWVVLA